MFTLPHFQFDTLLPKVITFQGRIIVLDQEGDVKNIYTGHPDVNHENKLFSPTGIVTTPSDKFVVADQNHHIIHIFIILKNRVVISSGHHHM
jgi:hypothetical protein